MATTDRDDLLSIRDMLTDAIDRTGSLRDAIVDGQTDMALSLLSGIRELMRDSKGTTYRATIEPKSAPKLDRLEEALDEIVEARDYVRGMVDFYRDRMKQDMMSPTVSFFAAHDNVQSFNYYENRERHLQIALDVLGEYV